MKAITRIEQCLAMALASAEDPSALLSWLVRFAMRCFRAVLAFAPSWPWPLPMLVAWTIRA